MVQAIITPVIGKAISASVVRGNEKNGQPNRLFDDAVEAFEAKGQWAAGKTINLLDGFLRGKRSIVSLRNQNGFIVLSLIINGRSQYTNQFLIGYNDPSRGWQRARDCSLINFNIWHRRARREITRLENQGRI